MERFSEIPEFKKFPGEAELREAPEVEKYAESPETPEAKKENLDGFFEEEVPLQEKIGRLLDEITPKKLNNPIVNKTLRLLTAFSIFMGGSSFFAKGVKAEEIEKEFLSPKNVATETIKEPTAPSLKFDWKKLVQKIEISAGVKMEQLPAPDFEVINGSIPYEEVKSYNFYRGVSEESYREATFYFFDPVNLSNNVAEFYQNLDKLKDKWNEKQKILYLQQLGQNLLNTYNYDMLEKNQLVQVSDEEMFGGVKDMVEGRKMTPTGTCGGIHAFLNMAAKKLGLEAWLQSGAQGREDHIWSGLTINTPKGKQIAFLNYDYLIITGTLNYKDALGIAERYMRSVATFNSYVSDEGKILFPVKSRAQEKIEEAAGIVDTGQALEEKLKEGEIKKEKNRLEIKLDPETKSIGLTKDYVGLTFFNYKNIYNNPYQSLEDLNALRGRLNLKGKMLSLEADATILHLNLKDLYGGEIAYDEFIGRLATDFINSHKFTKGEYGQFILNYGASLQAALRLPLDKATSEYTAGVMGEGAAGLRMIYLDPNNVGKFYIGASEVFRGQLKDFQSKEIVVKEAARNFTVGANINVYEGQILNLEATQSELDWGKKLKIKGGLTGKKWRAELQHEKSVSQYERFVPSAEKISASVGYQGPKWEIDVLGFKSAEKYAGAETKDTYGAEVKLKIFLW